AAHRPTATVDAGSGCGEPRRRPRSRPSPTRSRGPSRRTPVRPVEARSRLLDPTEFLGVAVLHPALLGAGLDVALVLLIDPAGHGGSGVGSAPARRRRGWTSCCGAAGRR